MADPTDRSKSEAEVTTLKFHLIKNQHYRVVHADGVFGGVTPQGWLNMTVFSERAPIPTVMVHTVGAEGRLGPEDRTQRVARDGVVRELEVGLTMSLDVAKSFHEWLGGKIEAMESGLAKRADKEKKATDK